MTERAVTDMFAPIGRSGDNFFAINTGCCFSPT
jgi:hypothetical protein